MLWQFFSLPGIENGIEYRYFSRYRIEVRNSSIVTTLLYIRGNLYPGPGVSVLQTLAPTSSNKHALKFLVDLDFLDQVYLIKGTLHFLTLG